MQHAALLPEIAHLEIDARAQHGRELQRGKVFRLADVVGRLGLDRNRHRR